MIGLHKDKELHRLTQPGGGQSEIQRLESLIEENRQMLEEIKSLRAGEELYGLAKISRMTDVIDDAGLVLGAKEKNPSMPGTLANGIQTACESAANSPKYLIKGMQLEPNTYATFRLTVNRTYLVTVANSYNVGTVCIIQTGASAAERFITEIVKASTYFNIEHISGQEYKVTSGGARGYLYALEIGAVL